MKVINNRNYYIKELYKAYPILEQIDNYNKGALVERALFKELLADELLNTTEDKCVGFLFVISGTIKIQKINEKGEETNLYNIEKGRRKERRPLKILNAFVIFTGLLFLQLHLPHGLPERMW